MKIEYVNIGDIYQNDENVNQHPNKSIEKIMKSIKAFGLNTPLGVCRNIVIVGNGRYEALQRLGYKKIPIVRLDHLSEQEAKAYALADNRIQEESFFDNDLLKSALEDLQNFNFDLDVIGFDVDEIDNLFDEETEIDYEKADETPEVKETTFIKDGDLIELGEHRLLCGDSTSENDVKKLMNGVKADMVFTDPPYGMKKKDIKNDNLNFDKLLEFNKKWIPISFKFLKDNGSWYCWGVDEPLMNIYSNILKPMIKEQKITFRNLITWDKRHGQGQLSVDFRMYPIADEKCLFVMCGVQGFNNNADNYYEGWDVVLNYLKSEKQKSKLTIKDFKRIAGHSEKSGCHWFDKSQWTMPTKEVYEKWQNYCKQNNIEAFKKEYEELKKEYEELKKEWYKTRAYFDNTHDNMNNVWHFDRHIKQGVEGGHSTPKPIPLCERAIKSSSRKNEIVLDLFLGSGSTLIACENLKRKCYGIELDPHYCQVIVERWCNYTEQDKIKINGKKLSLKELKG